MAKKYEFNDLQWMSWDGECLIVGLIKDAVTDLEEIDALVLPDEGELVEAEQVVGSLDLEDDSLELMVPVNGQILEVNEHLVDDPNSAFDNTEDNWLFKMDADKSDIKEFIQSL